MTWFCSIVRCDGRRCCGCVDGFKVGSLVVAPAADDVTISILPSRFSSSLFLSVSLYSCWLRFVRSRVHDRESERKRESEYKTRYDVLCGAGEGERESEFEERGKVNSSACVVFVRGWACAHVRAVSSNKDPPLSLTRPLGGFPGRRVLTCACVNVCVRLLPWRAFSLPGVRGRPLASVTVDLLERVLSFPGRT